MAVSDYRTNPDENTTISGINIAEGCAPSGINNAIRQLMADVKTMSQEQEGKFQDVTASEAGNVGSTPAERMSLDKPLLAIEGAFLCAFSLYTKGNNRKRKETQRICFFNKKRYQKCYQKSPGYPGDFCFVL